MTDAPGHRGSSTQNGTWSEPQGHWLPIARAIFRFAIAHTEGRPTNETNTLSLHNLRKTLREEARVQAAEIDVDGGYFMFHYAPSTGGAGVMSLSPWHPRYRVR
jgi:hypothetical protein